MAAQTQAGRRVRRLARTLLSRGGGSAEAAADSAPRYDRWLEHYHGADLADLDAACAGAGPEALRQFCALDADVWALLLTKRYDAYPNIQRLLPDMPEPGLQELWTGLRASPWRARPWPSTASWSRGTAHTGRRGSETAACSTSAAAGAG